MLFTQSDLISAIINSTFINTFCVYYFGNDNLIYEAIDKSNIVSIVGSNNHKYICKATGYIIAYEHIHNVTLLYQDTSIFQPHNRMLLICRYYNCSDFKYDEDAKKHALDIVKLNLMEKENYLEIYNNVYDLKELKSINRINFAFRDWVPYFGNSTFKINVFEYKPFFFFNDTGNLVGFEKLILDHIVKNWPAEYIIYPKFSWVEAAKNAFNNNGSMAASGYWIMGGMGYLVPTYPIEQINLVLLVPKPEMLPFASFVFQPIQLVVWGIIVFTTTTISMASYLIAQYEMVSMEYSKTEFLLNTISVLAANSNHLKLDGLISNILALGWTITSLLLITAYSAGISSINTIPRFYKPINTYEDLVNENIVCYCYEETAKDSLLAYDNFYIKTVGHMMVTKDVTAVPDGACTTAEVLRGGHIGTELDLSPYSKNHLRLFNERYFTTFHTFRLKKTSPLLKIFDKIIKQFHESGLYLIWLTLTFIESKEKVHSFNTLIVDSEQDQKPLNLAKLQGAFYLLIVGYLFAAISLLVECNKEIQK